MGDLRMPLSPITRGKRLTIDQNAPGRWLQQAHNNVHERALAAAGRSDESHAGALLDAQTHVLEHVVLLGAVAEMNGVQCDVATERKRFRCGCAFLEGQIENI